MTAYLWNAGDKGIYQKTLAAGVVDTVTFTGKAPANVTIWNFDTTQAVYATTDGTTPVSLAQTTYEIPAAGTAGAQVRSIPLPSDVLDGVPGVLKLIGPGTGKYSVTLGEAPLAV